MTGMGDRAHAWLRAPLMWLAAGAAVLLTVASANAAAMRFAVAGNGGNCVGCEWIAADGDITAQTPDDFAAFLKKNSDLGVQPSMTLNSTVGDIGAAMKLGELMRAARIQVSVGRSNVNFDDPSKNFPHEDLPGAKCFGACVFAFLGGAGRIAKAGDIGVQPFATAGTVMPSDKPPVSGEAASLQRFAAVLDYSIRMGADARLVSLAAGAADVRILTDTELTDLKIAWNENKMSGWRLEPYGKGAIAFAKSADERTTVTLYCDAGSKRFALVTREDGTPPDQAKQLFATLTGVSAFGKEVKMDGVSLQIKPKGYAVRVALPADIDWRRQTVETLSIDIVDTAPSASRSFLQAYMALTSLASTTSVAFRNCI
ncbi:hypothetical protein JQ557_33380 [Bradyrhizobium sp. U87765 SZCCT0131]|uniref:COG3904 family protein n=1 Tax=unclassified Bradyrhizobium TaxID=2631580 RepID=UPI001BAC0436|nr:MULTISPECIES: hypothetical protein [unclassified Bradyrhizobium]MBR1222935.1 hypothetical protein [Bradyrhizobium sp. U87765 SZCCT0131]MBR1262671.1 hypothetical protein [Bradyrhizobium sp. U87765 SZCCT0134]MBR1308857.1 hypothetical protein [Bradyrhizobium sp. U87765 SZCCT0110]MBR1318453.1 hypothetical protein [Bradyrhizobium sp. U87765 SZCCT0109]MBR1352157.1 hypothetical protein [Bradyrhizobium sp. U87765 SZCCT0048]